MKRSRSLTRTSPLSRAPIKRKQLTAEEKRARFARVYGSSERVEFVRRLPCLVCSSEPCDNAHVKGDGMGRKAEARFIVPLCTGLNGHHAVLHRMGTASFEAKYQRQLLGRTLLQWADLVQHAWENRAEVK